MSQADALSTHDQMKSVYEDADCLHALDEVQSSIENMALEITEALAKQNPIILVVMNGGLVFGGQLLTHLQFPLQVDYLHATRYRNETQGGELDWLVEPSIPMKNRTVLLVDDILDEGHTLKAILDYCKAQGANRVYSAVLADKLHKRKVLPDFKADFEGLKVQDRFVFGFGMDYQGYWRNAPGIYAVKGL